MRLIIYLILALALLIPSSVTANPLGSDYSKIALKKRQFDWPEWSLPAPFTRFGLEKDIIYPSSFQGDWLIKSSDLENPTERAIEYQAKFRLNSFGEVVGERSYNALSVGKAILGSQLLDVKDDPGSPNRQLAIFDEQIFLETKVIGRSQYSDSQSLLVVDELALQTFYNLNIARTTQVETLTRYELCKKTDEASDLVLKSTICGEQWQAIYPAPGDRLVNQPLKVGHYKLLLRRHSKD